MNPKKAVKALDAAPATVCGYTVYPVTLGLCALLEAIGSPLVTEAPRSLGAMAGTLYAFTRPASETRAVLSGADGAAKFARLSAEWADTVPLGVAEKLLDGVYAQVAAATDVLPDGDGGSDPRGATAGS